MAASALACDEARLVALCSDGLGFVAALGRPGVWAGGNTCELDGEGLQGPLGGPSMGPTWAPSIGAAWEPKQLGPN